MPSVYIPSPLRLYTGEQSAVELPGSTVAEVLRALGERFPEVKPHLFDDTGALRGFINVFVNDNDIRFLNSTETRVGAEDEVSIVPPVAGGNADPPELSPDEILRYSRHLILPEVTMAGQRKLKAASALIIGAGGLGSPVAMYLAAAGIGRLGLVDFDVVDASNLQRQIMHSTTSVGQSKLESAKHTIQGINPNVELDGYETAFTSENALDIARPYDLVIDGTDNFPTRYLVNDVCVLLGKPNVYGSIFRFEGQASVFWAERGPCYRCLFSTPPPPELVPSCAEGGVFGVLPGIIGVMQATEAIKLILGIGEPLIGRLVIYDALAMRFREIRLRKDPDCPICGENPTIHELIDYEEFCGVPRANGKQDKDEDEISAPELAEKLTAGGVYLLDVRQPFEWDIARIEGASLIPLDTLPERLGDIDGAREIVVYCRTGIRSKHALEVLHRAGYPSARHLAGGLHAWSDLVDPAVPKY